jgi:hypothetical protein
METLDTIATALIPVLSVAPDITIDKGPMPSPMEASAILRNLLPPSTCRRNQFVATQYSPLGNSLREFGWEPSLEYLSRALTGSVAPAIP